MNDYAHNIQFNHWNELLIQKECGNLDLFLLFFFQKWLMLHITQSEQDITLNINVTDCVFIAH